MPFPDWRLKDYGLHFQNNMYDPTRYRPFDEIEKEGLTDQIAKLRPMVILKESVYHELLILWGVENNKGIISAGFDIYLSRYKLTTPH